MLSRLLSRSRRLPSMCRRFNSMAEYDKVSNKALDILFEDLESLADASPSGFDVEFNNGVITLKLGNTGTYVVNRQPPNQQIWLSSPLSGPKRFDFEEGKKLWVYKRDGTILQQLLKTELSEIFSNPVNIRQ